MDRTLNHFLVKKTPGSISTGSDKLNVWVDSVCLLQCMVSGGNAPEMHRKDLYIFLQNSS